MPESLSGIKEQIHKKIAETFATDFHDFSIPQAKNKLKELITVEIARHESACLLSGERKTWLIQELMDEALGHGAIELYLRDPNITEIMVNGPDQIFVERSGRLYRTPASYENAKNLMIAIERIVSRVGRRVDESNPICDARLADGTRVNVILPPLSLNGPTLTLRKFREQPFTIADLINMGTLDRELAGYIGNCVVSKKNILVSGGTGTGKTTLLNALASFIPEYERIITIEDAAELKLQQPHVVRLESRPANMEGKGEVNIRKLVINALRMRPDRIIVGECRGGEALDMLQAMNTGHNGSLTTLHSNSPKDALLRLETLVLMAGMDLPVRAIRDQISGAIDVIIQITRAADGSRKVTSLAEVTGINNGEITLENKMELDSRLRHSGMTNIHAS